MATKKMTPIESDMEIEQKIFLGGKLSTKKKGVLDWSFLQLYGFMEPDQAFAHWFFMNFERLEKLNDNDWIIEILKMHGILEQLKTTTELTRLSMAVGETRKFFNASTGAEAEDSEIP